MKEIGEWKDLIMLTPLQAEPQILETGELADKKPEEVRDLLQVVKHQVVEKAVHPMLLHNLPQD